MMGKGMSSNCDGENETKCIHMFTPFFMIASLFDDDSKASMFCTGEEVSPLLIFLYFF